MNRFDRPHSTSAKGERPAGCRCQRFSSGPRRAVDRYRVGRYPIGVDVGERVVVDDRNPVTRGSGGVGLGGEVFVHPPRPAERRRAPATT